jgi:hypothetical protein
MEIVSIPLHGELRHQDSMGNVQHIKAGEVQIMSAGTGLTHSEYNASDSDTVSFLQIWVFPKRKNITPRYDQALFAAADRINRFQTVVSPHENEPGVLINQLAWFSLGDFTANHAGEYALQRPGNGAYFFVIDGAAHVAGERLEQRDGLGVEDATRIAINAVSGCRLLVIEVPMR